MDLANSINVKTEELVYWNACLADYANNMPIILHSDSEPVKHHTGQRTTRLPKKAVLR